MLCQNCKINDSTIHLYTNLNGQQKQIDLCQNCYKIIKTDPNNSLFKGITDLNNRDFDPFGDFFNDLNNFRPSSNNNVPPTQSGGGYGGNGGFGSQNRGPAQTPPPSQKKGLLDEYGINITEIARRGNVDPVIGRDEEIIRVIEILNRRTKNNPVLIGEPGVGKTAVVEGLAQKIVDGDVPHKLQGKEVIRLDVVSLVQGTGIRGQFEERMQKLMEEIRERKRQRSQQRCLSVAIRQRLPPLPRPQLTRPSQRKLLRHQLFQDDALAGRRAPLQQGVQIGPRRRMMDEPQRLQQRRQPGQQ